MNRREFTLALARQILFMRDILAPHGYTPQADWLKRSLHDQQELFAAGKSKCDGEEKVSAHQKAMALDIYAIGPGPDGKPVIVDVLKELPAVWRIIRHHWEELGGKPMISWDPCHFEG